MKKLIAFAMLCMCLSASTTAFGQRKNEAVDTSHSWVYRLSAIILRSIDETGTATSEFRQLYFDGAMTVRSNRDSSVVTRSAEVWYAAEPLPILEWVELRTEKNRTTVHLGDAAWEVVGSSDSTRRFVWLDSTQIEPTLEWKGKPTAPAPLKKVYNPSLVGSDIVSDFRERMWAEFVFGPKNGSQNVQLGPIGIMIGEPLLSVDITLPISRKRGQPFAAHAGLAIGSVTTPEEGKSDVGYSFWGVQVNARLRSASGSHELRWGCTFGHRFAGIDAGQKLIIPRISYTYFPLSWLGLTAATTIVSNDGLLGFAGIRFRYARKAPKLPK